MIEFHKLADGTWKCSGEAVLAEEPVTISFHNARPDGPHRFFLRGSTVPAINAPEPDKVKHSGEVEGEYTWADAVAMVEKMILENTVGTNNLCRIQSAIYRQVEDGFALAQRDLIAKHPEWLRKDVPPVPPRFHEYRIDIYRPSDGQRIMSRVGSLELMQLIKDRLSAKFGGRICDPEGKVLEQWTPARATD